MIGWRGNVVSLRCNCSIHQNEVGHGKGGRWVEGRSTHAWFEANNIIKGLLFVWDEYRWNRGEVRHVQNLIG